MGQHMRAPQRAATPIPLAQRRAPTRSNGAATGPEVLLQLQRIVGNRALVRHLTSLEVIQRGKVKTKKKVVHNPRTPYERAVVIDDKNHPGGGQLAFNEMARGLEGWVDFDNLDTAKDYGTGMSGYLHDWNHSPEGSGPSVAPSWWPSKQDATYKAQYKTICGWFSRYMVQGHLLNENLGGPGSDMRNLAPITKVANSEHLHQIEEQAKSLNIEDDESINYTVTVLPGPPMPGAFAKFLSGLPTAEAAEGARLVSLLPRGFECTLQKVDADGAPLPAHITYTVINRES